jgi:hypothetical protein
MQLQITEKDGKIRELEKKQYDLGGTSPTAKPRQSHLKLHWTARCG